jgi:hypothetical protein
MVPVLHAGTPHRVSLRGFERSHPQLVCVLTSSEYREMGRYSSEARMEREYKRDENTIIHPLKISLVSEAQVM